MIWGLLCKIELLLNKSTKIRINYWLGALLSLVLLYVLYYQVRQQLSRIDGDMVWDHASNFLLAGAILLMPLNLMAEVSKWKFLAGSAQPIRWTEAWKSYMAGLSLSLLTPNRVGEYPGRILYLKRKNTPRLLSVSILGIFAQLIAIMIFGFAGLIYYNLKFPGTWPLFFLIGTIVGGAILLILYLRFERWAIRLEHLPWFRRFKTYKYLMKRFSIKDQLTILLLSMAKILVFTAQYLTLLYWMNVSFPIWDGFFMAALFFWILAVIPSIALAELGIRGNLSLLLFGQLSNHTVGIIAATGILWCINLALPAALGSLLWLKRKI